MTTYWIAMQAITGGLVLRHLAVVAIKRWHR